MVPTTPSAPRQNGPAGYISEALLMIRLANAPCSWGILEFDRTTTPATYEQVVDEISATGYAGTELGDWGFMPTDPRVLRNELTRRQLQLVAAFVPIALAETASHDEGVARALRTAALLRGLFPNQQFEEPLPLRRQLRRSFFR